MITFSRDSLKSDAQRGIPSENQHVGVVIDIKDGKPIVRHYTNEYKDEPISNVTFNENIKYVPSKITRFAVPSEIASKANVVLRSDMTEAEKSAALKINNTDFSPLILSQEQLDDLVYSAMAMVGTESK